MEKPTTVETPAATRKRKAEVPSEQKAAKPRVADGHKSSKAALKRVYAKDLALIEESRKPLKKELRRHVKSIIRLVHEYGLKDTYEQDEEQMGEWFQTFG